jgi:hypothetical protein
MPWAQVWPSQGLFVGEAVAVTVTVEVIVYFLVSGVGVRGEVETYGSRSCSNSWGCAKAKTST